MLLEHYQQIPSYLSPIAFSIGSFSVRWYSISYIAGLIVIYLALLWRLRNNEFERIAQISKQFPGANFSNIVLDWLLISFFAALLGGRLGYVLFYDLQHYLAFPREIIFPFDNEGRFVGLYGMSYHGALLGILLASFIFLRLKKINFLAWADFVMPAVPLGYFFGRVGNFLNGELYGRVTNSSLGMFFNGQNQLRHPSQLYEALLEGLLLFFILWILRNKKQEGFLLATYLIGYGLLRFVGEFFREPDQQLGFVLIYFTMGQLLSLLMAIFGMVLLFKNRNKWYN